MDRSKVRWFAWTLLALSAVISGCDPLADKSYRGEPLRLVQGTIESDLTSTPPAEVILLWINWATDPGTVVGNRVPVLAKFPARFKISVYGPPPANALNTLPSALDYVPEPKMAFAWLVVLKAGAAPPGRTVLTHADVKGLSTGDVLGWAQDYVVAYIDGPAAESTYASQILGAPLGAGFHLMHAVGASPADVDAIRQCFDQATNTATCASLFEPLAPADDAMPTDVRVRLTADLEHLRLPLFALPSRVQRSFGVPSGG